MKSSSRTATASSSTFLRGLVLYAGAGFAADYRFLKEILIGGAGGFAYLTVDSAARRLYVSHDLKVVVLDLDKGTVAGEIDDAPGVHGIAVAPDLKPGYNSNGREAKVSIFDLASLKTVIKVDTGTNPDAILYESTQQKVYTFNVLSQMARAGFISHRACQNHSEFLASHQQIRPILSFLDSCASLSP